MGLSCSQQFANQTSCRSVRARCSFATPTTSSPTTLSAPLVSIMCAFCIIIFRFPTSLERELEHLPRANSRPFLRMIRTFRLFCPFANLILSFYFSDFFVFEWNRACPDSSRSGSQYVDQCWPLHSCATLASQLPRIPSPSLLSLEREGGPS